MFEKYSNKYLNEAATDRFLQSAARNLVKQWFRRPEHANRNSLKSSLLSMPLANRLKPDELDKIVDYAMQEMGLEESVNEKLNKKEQNLADLLADDVATHLGDIMDFDEFSSMDRDGKEDVVLDTLVKLSDKYYNDGDFDKDLNKLMGNSRKQKEVISYIAGSLSEGIQMIEEARGAKTQFTKPGKDGDIYFSKREGNAIAIRKGDVLQSVYVYDGEPKLGKIHKTDKRWDNEGPISRGLLTDLTARGVGGLYTRKVAAEDAKVLLQFLSDMTESINEGLLIPRFCDFVNEERVYGLFNDAQGKPTKLDKEILDIALKALPKEIINNIEDVEGSGAWKNSGISPPTVSNRGQSRGEIEYTMIYIYLDKPMGRNKIQGITVGLRKRTSGPGTGYLYMSVSPDSHHSFGPDAEGAIEFWDNPSSFLQKLYNEKFKNWF